MKHLLIIVCLLQLPHFLSAQTNYSTTHKWTFNVVAGIGRARFETKRILVEDYPTLEVRLGCQVSRVLFRRMRVTSGMNFCFRSKRESHFRNNVYHGRGMPLLFLDETASEKNHTACEVPLMVGGTVRRTATTINAGLMSRFWAPNNLAGDALKSQTEFGYLAGISQRILSRLSLGIDFYWGITNLNHVYVNGAQPVRMTNQFAEVSAVYAFGKKSN